MQSVLVSGDTLNFLTTVPGYAPADGWVLKFRLVPRAAGTPVEFATTADGGQHRATVAASTTAAWVAGEYSWFSWVEKGAEQYSLERGTVRVLPNPRTNTAGSLDLRTDAQIALDNVDAALRGKASTAVMSYRIGERELRSYSIAELLQLRSHLANQVSNEQAASAAAKGLASPRKLYVRLGRV